MLLVQSDCLLAVFCLRNVGRLVCSSLRCICVFLHRKRVRIPRVLILLVKVPCVLVYLAGDCWGCFPKKFGARFCVLGIVALVRSSLRIFVSSCCRRFWRFFSFSLLLLFPCGLI